MAIAKADRFEHKNLKVKLVSDKFPPDTLLYEGKFMTLLGFSNKQDLVPNIEDKEVVKAVFTGIGVKQLIYSDQDATLYDVCMYKDSEGQVFLHAIRTRQMPEKKKVKKSDENKITEENQNV